MVFVSPLTRFEAKDAKATKRPLAESEGKALSLFGTAPAESAADPRRLAPQSVVDKDVIPVVSVAATRFGWAEEKATKRPVAEIEPG